MKQKLLIKKAVQMMTMTLSQQSHLKYLIVFSGADLGFSRGGIFKKFQKF